MKFRGFGSKLGKVKLELERGQFWEEVEEEMIGFGPFGVEYSWQEYGFELILSRFEAEMERIQSTQKSEDDSHSVDAFASVIGPEHPGRVRLYGRRVTKTLL
ncbi:uncharacterized protein LOC107767913 [Nicotiana tabacum]|uniref:Uncharacterized protein LOC107767913 n=1 Tax=Nicotiana tabacum TaxID=4097 RepID=A0AC58RST4_TOBAC